MGPHRWGIEDSIAALFLPHSSLSVFARENGGDLTRATSLRMSIGSRLVESGKGSVSLPMACSAPSGSVMRVYFLTWSQKMRWFASSPGQTTLSCFYARAGA